MNQLFGYQILPKDLSVSPVVVEGALPVEIPLCPKTAPRQLEVAAYPNTRLQTHYCPLTGALVYIWGIPVHPTVIQSKIAAWSVGVITEQRYDLFRDLLGPFVAIIDEPKQQRVTFVADPLGVRPMFIGHSKDRMIFGSEVWPLLKAGLVNGDVDYDAVSAWLAYRYNCTEGSLFSELHRLPAGAVSVFQNGRFKTIPYIQWESSDDHPTEEQAVENLHRIISSTTGILLKDQPRVALALSGGYDSRYLLALASAVVKQPIECTTVAVTEQEDAVARQVAETVGAAHKRIPCRSSEWDLYENVFHAAPDGFPLSKNLTYLVAQVDPGTPMLHGFMGDSLIRGSKDTYLGKYETEWKEDLAGILQRKHLGISFDMLRGDIAKQVRERSLAPMEAAVREGSRIGKIFGWADFYYRQRLYISNNFNQHLGLTEAVVPFYAWPLLKYKMVHDYRCFNQAVYKKIFERHFPALSKIPHAGELHKAGRSIPFSACAKTWARRLSVVMCDKNQLTLLARKHCLPRLLAGIAGVGRVEVSVLTFQRLYWLEQQMRDARLDLDWERI
jgi:Asparagine synthase/Glutamine amidotransferase domain